MLTCVVDLERLLPLVVFFKIPGMDDILLVLRKL